jgi:hypothetical protein
MLIIKHQNRQPKDPFSLHLDGQTTKTKVVYLKKLCNFVVYNLFILNHLSNEIMFKFLIFEI